MVDFTISHDGPSGVWQCQYLRERCHKFPTHSSGGATLFDFVDVCNDSKLCTGGVGDDHMRGAATDWWPAACSLIKARGRSLLSTIALLLSWLVRVRHFLT